MAKHCPDCRRQRATPGMWNRHSGECGVSPDTRNDSPRGANEQCDLATISRLAARVSELEERDRRMTPLLKRVLEALAEELGASIVEEVESGG